MLFRSTEVIGGKNLSDNFLLEEFSCGHARVVEITHATIVNKPLIKTLTGKETFKYQDDGINLIETSGFRALVADEMGLGKTIQANGAIALHKDTLLPAIIVCKSIAKFNWMNEVLDTLCASAIPQVINKSTDIWHDVFPIHICSYDMIRMHMVQKKSKRNADAYYGTTENTVSIRSDVKAIFDRARCIVLDECHTIKNDIAARTVAIKTLCKGKKSVIALSGTPIKNNAAEFFPVLNILHPEIFNNKASFISTYCDQVWNGRTYKVGGLKNPEYFKQRTKHFLIRREMDDVLPDLPAVMRKNSFVELEEDVEKIYNKELNEFVDFMEENQDNKDFGFYNDILTRLNKLRHITGISKTGAAREFVEDFLTSTNRKITLFVHHKRVADILETKINEMIVMLNTEMGMHLGKVLTLGADDKNNAEKIVEAFRLDENRVLIASTLSAGESINLQFCSDCLLVERQWNPANEEQAAVGRFKRIGQTKTVNLNYLLAVGTIDDYFTDLVEQKREIFNETMRGEKSLSSWNEQSIIMELANTLMKKGKKKWTI